MSQEGVNCETERLRLRVSTWWWSVVQWGLVPGAECLEHRPGHHQPPGIFQLDSLVCVSRLSLTNQIISNIIFFAVQIINNENKCKFKVRFKVFFSDFLNYKALVPVEYYKMLQTFESFGHNSLLSSLEQYWPVAGWVSLQHSLGIYPQAELSWVCRPSPPFKLPSAKILEHVQSSPNTQD